MNSSLMHREQQKKHCKDAIRSYLRGTKSINAVLAFFNPPYESPLSRETVAELLQVVSLEGGRSPIPERLATLKLLLVMQ